jgi:hypothetical protein
MSRNKQNFDSKWIIWEIIFRNICNINLRSLLWYTINFYSLFQIICNSNNLRMVTFNIYLLNFSLTKSANVTSQEIFKQKWVFFKISNCHKSWIHNNIISFFMIAQYFHQMIINEFLIISNFFLFIEFLF